MAFNIVQHRRGAEELWKKLNIVPADGELIIVEFQDGLRKFKVGDGKTPFNRLSYLDEILMDNLSTLETSLQKAEFSLKELGLNQQEHLTYITDLQQELNQVNLAVEEAFSKVESHFNEADTEVLTKANSYTDTKFYTLKEDLTSNFTEVSDDLHKKQQELTALQESLKTTTNDTAELFNKIELLENADAITEQTISELDSKQKTFFAQTNTNFNSFIQQLDKLSLDIDTIIQTAIESIQTDIDKIKEQHETDFDNLSNTFASDHVEYLAKLETQKSEITDTIHSIKKELINKITAASDTFQKDLELSTKSLENDFKAADETILENLNFAVETLTTQITTGNLNNAQLTTDLLALNELVLDLKTKYLLLNNEISTIKNDISSLDTSLSAELNELTEQVNLENTKIKEDITKEISDRTSADEELLASIQTYVEQFEAQIDTLNNKHVQLTSSVNTITARLTINLSNLSTQLQDAIAVLEDSIKEQANRIETNRSNLSQHDQKIKDLETLINTNKTTISNLKVTHQDFRNSINKNSLNINNIASAVNNQQTEISEIKKINQDQDTQLKQLILKDIEHSQNITNLDSSISANSSVIENLKTNNQALRTDVAVNRLNITSIATAVNNQADIIETLQDDLDILELDVDAKVGQVQRTVASMDNKLKTIEAGLDSEMTTFKAEVNRTLDSKGDEITEVATETQTKINKFEKDIEDLEIRMQTHSAQIAAGIQSLYPNLDDDSESNDGEERDPLKAVISEVADIRAGYDGNTYGSAGEAVRQIGLDLDELKESLPSYIPDNAVDGLSYENNMLYLTSNGSPVGDPVEITGGTGGGGGSISTVKLNNLNGSNTLTFASGTKAELKFEYDSLENGVSTGNGTCTVFVENKQVKSFSVAPGVPQILDVAEFLKSGTNTVKITCADQYGVSRSLTYKVTLIELKIVSSFNDAMDYSGDITFKYTPFGALTKTIHILVDNVQVYTFETSTSGKQITATIPADKIPLNEVNTAHGSHVISAYISAVLDGKQIFSNTLYYDIVYLDKDRQEPMICSIFTQKESVEGNLVSIPYRVYDPTTELCNINLIVSSIVSGQETVISTTTLQVDRSKQVWNIRNYPEGIVKFTISYSYRLNTDSTITKSHTLTVSRLDIDVEAATNDLQLYLTSSGKSNNDINRDTWTYGNYSTSFENFNWKSNGWVTDASGDTCLRLNGDARAIIEIAPFEEDFKTYGKTFEFDFVVRDVNNRDAIIIDCFESGRGFQATADTATLKSSGTMVSCNYKDEERVRISISIESTSDGTNFVSMYLNGILSSCQRYANTDNFTQSKPVYITLGTSLCGLDIYNIRIYNTALTTEQILENYIADIPDTLTKFELFNDNNIYDENTGLVSYEKVKQKLPVITFTGDMPKFKGDKKKNSVRMKFEHPENPELNFDEVLEQIDVQGTSSQYYVRKNWKTKHPTKHTHMVGQIPAKVFCIKVDYAEATGTHNTQCANLVETLYDRTITLLPAQDETIKGLNDEVIADSRVRTTIAGFPCVIFEKATEESTPVFSSKANFNYDKDAETAFGFTEYFDVECWEFCNNTSAPCNFLGTIQNPEDVTTWITDFEPRYAQNLLQDANGKPVLYEGDAAYSIERFKVMHDWVCSTATYTVGTVSTPKEIKTRLWAFNNELSTLAYKKDENEKIITPVLAENTYWYINEELTEFLVTYDNDGAVICPSIVSKENKDFWQFNNDIAQVIEIQNENEKPKVLSSVSWYLDGEKTPYFAQTNKDGDLILPELTDEKTYWSIEGVITNHEVKYIEDQVTNTPVISDRGTWKIDGIDTGLVATSKNYLAPEEIIARRDKFKKEFENYFDLHYSLIYYVFTFFALMVDQRAKNMFLTYWGKKDSKGNEIGKWYPYFYDNDTSFGINNEGARVFDYYHEDIDLLDGANVYNGQNSILWDNFRVCFADEIRETYANLRNSKKLTYEKLVDQFITQGSDMWSAAIYNEDAEYKYVSMARPDANGKIDASNLYQIKGTAEQHFRYFIDNRFKYCDSKWNTASYLTVPDPADTTKSKDNFIFLRIYTPQTTIEAVPANPNITIIPFSDMYAGVKYKANGTLLQQRAKKNEPVEFSPPKQADGTNETFNDTETAIYGASEISSLGDLSGLYLGVINVASATKLTELIIGNHTIGYTNPNFREIAVGSNRLLRKIDLTNCTGLGAAGDTPQKTLDVSGCINIEEIYAEGTNLTSITLPDSGYLKILYLPETMESLTIKNHLQLALYGTENESIEGLKIANYSTIKTLVIENCPKLDTWSMLNNCKTADNKWTVEWMRLTGISEDVWSFANIDFLMSLEGIHGITANGTNLDAIEFEDGSKKFFPYLQGTCYIEKITGDEYNLIQKVYPDLNITFGELASKLVIYNYYDNENPLYEVPVSGYNNEKPNCENPDIDVSGLIADILKSLSNSTDYVKYTDKYDFEWLGWTTYNPRKLVTITDENGNPTTKEQFTIIEMCATEDELAKNPDTPDIAFIGETNENALNEIVGTRILYPTFKGIHKAYTVEFRNPLPGLLSNSKLLHSTNVLYGREAIYTGDVPLKEENAELLKYYSFTGWLPSPANITANLTCYAQFIFVDTDDNWYTLTLSDIDGNYILNESTQTMIITKCKNIFNAAVRIPNAMTVGETIYHITRVDGFSDIDNKNNLVALRLADDNEPETNIAGILEIGSSAFGGHYNLSTVQLPSSLTIISTLAFSQCFKLTAIEIPKNVHTIEESAFQQCTSLKSITVADGNKTFRVENRCLINNDSNSTNYGTVIQIFDADNFSFEDFKNSENHPTKLGGGCGSYLSFKELEIPNKITKIASYAFSNCNSLITLTIPGSLQSLGHACFAWASSLKNLTLNEGITELSTYVFDSSALESLVLPASIKSLASNSFGNTPTLRSITFRGTPSFIHGKAFVTEKEIDDTVIINVPWTVDEALADLNTVTDNVSGIGFSHPNYLKFAKDSLALDIYNNKKYPAEYLFWGLKAKVVEIHYGDSTVISYNKSLEGVVE